MISRLISGWRRFWFEAEGSPGALELIRIGVAIGVILVHGFLGADLWRLYGPEGWVPVASVTGEYGVWALWSPLNHITAPWQLHVFLGGLMAASVALLVGWRTAWVKWLVWAGHLSLVHRNPIIGYGVDSILSSLLWVLCFAPAGRSLSLDARRWARQGRAVAYPAWGHACLRLIQIQMALSFFFAGVSKLQGDSWWQGSAVWTALTNHEYGNIPIGWLADQFWIVNLFTYAAVILEVGYIFMVWGRPRLLVVASAVALHLGIGVMMGLYAFSLVMAVGHLAFLRSHEIEAALSWMRRRFRRRLNVQPVEGVGRLQARSVQHAGREMR